MRYVIAGNSVAACAAVEGIREQDRNGDIIIISPENYTAYCRPLITYVLAGKVGENRLPYKKEDFYKKNNVKVIYGKKVEGIDVKTQTLFLSDGEKLNYDKFLIAVGGVPFIPPIENINGRDVYTFTNIADMHAMIKRLPTINKIVVIGAGMIGMKVAEALRLKGKNVVIIELMDRILPMALDKKASRIAEETLEQAGIEYILGDSVVGIERTKEGKVYAVELKSGRKIYCDTVVVAVGVRPNIDPFKETEIETNKGVIVDDRMETSVEGIFAAGDVTEAYDIILGSKRPNLIWPLAYRQGYIAGSNMAGGKKRYVGGFPLNSIGFFNFHVISAGISAVEEEEDMEILTYYDEKNRVYKKIVIGNNKIMGFLMVNDVRRAGIYTGLMWARLDVSTFKDLLISKANTAESCNLAEENASMLSFEILKARKRFGWAALPKSYRKFFTAFPSRIEEVCAFDEEGVYIYGEE